MNKYIPWRFFHVEAMPRSFWNYLTFTGVFLGGYIGWLLTQNISQINPALPDGAVTLGAFSSFVITWIGGKRVLTKQRNGIAPSSGDRRLHFLVPLAFSIALLFQGVGSSLITLYDLGPTPWGPPIPGMIVLLGRHLAVLVGIFLLPRNTLSGRAALRFVMDSLLLIVTMATFSWYFLLGPILFESQGVPPFAIAINVADTVFGLLVLSSLLLLSRSVADRGLRLAIRALSLAVVLYVFVDVDLVLQDVHGLLVNTIWLSAGWIGSNFIIALSLQVIRRLSPGALTRSTSTLHHTSLVATPIWRSLLSYALVPVVIALAVSLWVTERGGVLAIGTYCGCLLLLIVIFIRQVVGIQEVHGLNRDLQRLQGVLEEKSARLEALATTDPLTELPNHRALMDQLSKELSRAQRYERSVSLLFFDADRFKKVNDTYGHAAGDAVLRHISQLAGSVLRSEDTLARFGGEEFVIVLPETEADEAERVAERLRAVIAASPVILAEGQREISVTVSIGVSTCPVDASQEQELLSQADAAMYIAKRMGRNQVRTAQEARRIGQDIDLMALLQEAGQNELTQREGMTVQQLREIYTARTIYSLLSLLEHRNQGQGAHAHATSDLATAIARQMGVDAPSVLRIGMAALLHDIGQVALPDTLLLKETELTTQERALLDEHALFGSQILESSPFLADLAPAIRHHHEHWDGNGSPDHLCREDIPLAARIIAVAEAYDFMQREHPYLLSISAAAALAELKRCASTQFDPTVVQALSEVLSDLYEQRTDTALRPSEGTFSTLI